MNHIINSFKKGTSEKTESKYKQLIAKIIAENQKTNEGKGESKT